MMNNIAKEENEATPSSHSDNTALISPSQPTVTQGVAGNSPPPASEDMPPEETVDRGGISPAQQAPPSPSIGAGGSQPPPGSTVINAEPKVEYEEELLLKWDDHHKSFFEAAEDLCHQEQFIDVTLSCGEINFPAHKLVLSVCSPYFRNLFLRNPCKHPIVVLKDVHFKYMKLLLMYMYRGEVSCPQEDLHGLLKTARGLQIRGLVELERKREAEGFLASATGSPIKRAPSEVQDGASTTSCDLDSRGGDDFSIDEVRSRLHGQLEIQPIVGGSGLNQPLRPPSNMPPWLSHAPPTTGRTPPPAHTTTSSSKAFATSSSNDGTATGSEGHHSDPDDPRNYRMPLKRGRETPNNGLDNHWGENNGRSAIDTARASPLTGPPRSRSRPSSSSSATAASANNAALLAAAQAAGMPLSALDPSDPMSSMNALLAAAQAHSGSSTGTPTSLTPTLPLPTTLSSLLPPSNVSASATSTSSPSAASSSGVPISGPPPTATTGTNGNGQGVDLSQQAAAMANVSQLQLYYYMQKVASAGMGNPKERKECPICSKTLYDRSTWNRHMRIHTGEKPYPCRFCGRRFRTNYNKLGHEKKCPDRHSMPIPDQPQPATGGRQENVIYR